MSTLLNCNMLRHVTTLMLSILIMNGYSQTISNQWCDSIKIQYDLRNQQDTSHVIVTDFALADTTEIELFGQVIDQSSFKPLTHANVLLHFNGTKHAATTDGNGKFKILCFLPERPGKDYQEWYSGWNLNISCSAYRCLEIVNPIGANLIGLKIKLMKRSN
jgi:hypothetical protein